MALGRQPGAVQRRIGGVCLPFAAPCGSQGAQHGIAQQALQSGLGVGPEVVASLVHHAQHHELVLGAAGAQKAGIVLGVLLQREGGGRRQRAHRAFAHEALAGSIQ